MAFKRKFTPKNVGRGSIRLPFIKRGSRVVRGSVGMRTARRAAEIVFNMHVETKSGIRPFPDGTELGHNRINLFGSNLLATVQGTSDEENTMGSAVIC